MASKHEKIVLSVIRDWSVDKKGRLYKMTQGRAVPLNADHPIDFGPLKGLKGFPDIFGFTHRKVVYPPTCPGEVKDFEILPVFTVIEVKTKTDRIRPAQKDFLSFVKSIGGHAYIAWEADNDKGYFLQEWTG